MNEMTTGTESSITAGSPPASFAEVVDRFCEQQAAFRARLAQIGGDRCNDPQKGGIADPEAHQKGP